MWKISVGKAFELHSVVVCLNYHLLISDHLSLHSLGAFKGIRRKNCRMGKFLTWLKERFPDHTYMRPFLLSWSLHVAVPEEERLAAAVTGRERGQCPRNGVHKSAEGGGGI